jgi:hypothetical protein
MKIAGAELRWIRYGAKLRQPDIRKSGSRWCRENCEKHRAKSEAETVQEWCRNTGQSTGGGPPAYAEASAFARSYGGHVGGQAVPGPQSGGRGHGDAGERMGAGRRVWRGSEDAETCRCRSFGRQARGRQSGEAATEAWSVPPAPRLRRAGEREGVAEGRRDCLGNPWERLGRQ